MNDLEIGIVIGVVVGGLLAWAVTTWRLSQEPHCLDCECEGCRIVRGQQA